jgi:hypothetical protein
VNDDEPDLELVVPFVTVASEGGPHDDESYVCGWEMGNLDHYLMSAARLHLIPQDTLIHTSNLDQADLVAMNHGFSMIPIEDHDDWTIVRLTPPMEED